MNNRAAHPHQEFLGVPPSTDQEQGLKSCWMIHFGYYSRIGEKSLDKPHFCPDLSSGEEPALFVDRKDTGETITPISFLQEDQISQPGDAFDFEKSSDSFV